jgi:precorrin-2 dehydrogenase/sirohydrochlorin ferrochelatase
MISTSDTHTMYEEGAEDHDEAGAPLYALFLDMVGRRCLVVGGGEVAARKVDSLLEAGARVVVVAPELGPSLSDVLGIGDAQGRAPSEAGRATDPEEVFTWVPRPFDEEDARGCFLVIAATDDPDANRAVALSARRNGALANVVDDPSLCDFFVPSVLRRGRLQVAVSSGGVAPGLSMRLRRRLEDRFSAEWGPAVAAVGAGRTALLRGLALDEEARRRALAALASLDVAGLVDRGGAAAVAGAVDALIYEATASCTSRPSE